MRKLLQPMLRGSIPRRGIAPRLAVLVDTLLCLVLATACERGSAPDASGEPTITSDTGHSATGAAGVGEPTAPSTPLPSVAPEAPRAVTDADVFLPAALPGFEPTRMQFFDFQGGDGFYCGTRQHKPSVCWGRAMEPRLHSGQQLSVGKDFACTLGGHNTVACSGSLKHVKFDNHVTLISAGPEHLCTQIGNTGPIRCRGRRPELDLPESAGGDIREMAVGRDFACGRDYHGGVHCWGNTARLGLPKQLRGQQLAAGDDFLCVVSGRMLCFGQRPEGVAAVTPGPFAAVSARGQTLCAVTPSGYGWCKGGVSSQAGNVKRYHLARGSHCATFTSGAVRCWGSTAHGQLERPVVRGALPAALPPALRRPLLDEFLKGLLPVDLPLETSRNAAPWLGKAIPPRLAVPLLGAVSHRHTEYHYGVKSTGLAGKTLITVFDDVEGQLIYFLMDDAGQFRSRGVLFFNDERRHGPYVSRTQENVMTITVNQTESLLRADGTVLVTRSQHAEVLLVELQGDEVIHSKRQVCSGQMQVHDERWDAVGAWDLGRSSRPVRTLPETCATRWPFSLREP